MNVEAFIRQHITTALVAEGFSEIVAQGGLLRVWNTTGDALRILGLRTPFGSEQLLRATNKQGEKL